MVKIFRNDLIYSVSTALDYVEHDLVTISPHHSRRIALISALLGQYFGLSHETLLNLAICAALHDNALSEYEQLKASINQKASPESFAEDLGLHCTIGERNISALPFYPFVQGAILYHHENADGSGPFQKKAADTPLLSRLIHIADTVDAQYDLSHKDTEKFLKVRSFVSDNVGTLYDEEVANTFLNCFTTPDKMFFNLDTLNKCLYEVLPETQRGYSPQELVHLADFFSKIIDYKSRFTYNHSSGVAQKAWHMAEYYGWDEETQAQLYLAASLHDVGKLMTQTEILEKPGKLTDNEFKHIQEHAKGTYMILHAIRGLENVARWAYNHHEKLNGSGYPFGKEDSELNFQDRLMACLDIYQALREDRPYRLGMFHKEAMVILQDMVENGQIDATIVADIDHCFKDSPNVPMDRIDKTNLS